jgi:hypothetical protein
MAQAIERLLATPKTIPSLPASKDMQLFSVLNGYCVKRLTRWRNQ